MEPPHGRKPGRGLPRPHRRQPAGRRRWAWGALALTLAAGLAGAALLLRGRAVPPPWRLGSVTEGPVVAAIIASGTLNPVITVQVGSQVSGQILALSADFNSEVSKGELIARIDPSLFETQVKQAEADLGVARAAILVQRAGVTKAGADLGVARATLDSLRQQTRRAQVAAEDAGRIADRRQKLYATGSGTLADRDTAQANFDGLVAQQHAAEAQEVAQRAGIDSQAAALQTAEANLAMAEAQVGQKQAVLDNARVNLDHTYIRAPVDGTVIQRNVDVGQTVAASLQAPLLFTIAQDLREMQVDASVDEADVGGVRVGQAVEFGVDAYPGRVFRGAVIQVRKAPQAVQNVVTYDAVISAANPDQALLPGLTATVRILTARRDKALLVPNAALRWRLPGSAAAPPAVGAGTVFVPGPQGEPQPVALRTGIADPTVTEVLEGALQPGQAVIIGERTATAASSSIMSSMGRPRL